MNFPFVKLISFAAITAISLANTASACTNFRVTAKDGSVIIARSMEFAVNFNSNIRTSNRGRIFKTTAPDGTAGATWKAKYGYVYLDGMNVDFAVDGMNEVGLSVQDLLFPDYAKYQTVPAGQSKQALSYVYFADWLLSNFRTIDEIKEALPRMYVFEQKITVPGIGNDLVFPLHYSVYDASGRGIVIEFIDGKMHIDDNKIGVMTNSPSYNWHLTNQNNYVHLIPTNPSPVMDNGVTFVATGQGAGMVGLPGDISPPSRFVKMAVLTRVAFPADNAEGAVNMAEHIINNVDIPLGLAREPGNGNYTNETTQWVVFKDLTHKVFYYRTYNNLTLRAVNVAKIDFSENAKRLVMPIKSEAYIQDITQSLLQSPQQPAPILQASDD